MFRRLIHPSAWSSTLAIWVRVGGLAHRACFQREGPSEGGCTPRAFAIVGHDQKRPGGGAAPSGLLLRAFSTERALFLRGVAKAVLLAARVPSPPPPAPPARAHKRGGDERRPVCEGLAHFLRVAAAYTPTCKKSPGHRRDLKLCALPCSLMAKVELHALR